MKIVFNLLDASVGGGQRVAAGIAAALREAGHEVGVATPDVGPALEWFPDMPHHIVDLISLKRPYAVGPAARIFHDYDLVYSHTSAPGATLAGAAAAKARRPHVIHQHIPPHFSPARPIAAGQRLLYAAAARKALVIAVAQHVADAASAAGATDVVVVPNGVSVPEPAPPHGAPPLRVGQLARLDVQKGIDVFLEAAARLSPGSVVALGTPEPTDAWGSELHRRAHELGIEVVSPAGAEFLRSLDVVAFPSRWEGHPLVLMEAMALGKPVVATTIPGVVEMFAEHPDAAVLVPPEDPAALAAALDELVESPERRSRVGQSARALIEDRYSLAIVHTRIIELLQARV